MTHDPNEPEVEREGKDSSSLSRRESTSIVRSASNKRRISRVTKRRGPLTERNSADDVDKLLKPGGFVAAMEALDRRLEEEDSRHEASTSELLADLYRNALVAHAFPDALTEFLRDPYWDGNRDRPKPGDLTSITRALIKYNQRKVPKSKTRQRLHTWFSAARELLARKTPPDEVISVIANTKDGISGLRDAFKLRSKNETGQHSTPDSLTAESPSSFPMRLPTDLRNGQWQRFNQGDWYFVCDIGNRKCFIRQTDMGRPPRIHGLRTT